MICKTCGNHYELDERAFNDTYCSHQFMRVGTAPPPEVERLDAEWSPSRRGAARLSQVRGRKGW